MQANISFEEYAIMYKVYQQSVRQTETFKELQKIKQEAKDLNKRHMDFKPSGKIKNLIQILRRLQL